MSEQRSHKAIGTLKRLLDSLDQAGGPVPPPGLFAALERYKPNRDELAKYQAFSRGGYRRNLIHTGPGYQAWLLCWKRGQFSPIHDHTGSACGVRIIQGVATETVFRKRRDGRLVRGPTRTQPAGSVIASIDADIHVMGCMADAAEDLVSLHIYSPALTGMKFYPEELVVKVTPSRSRKSVSASIASMRGPGKSTKRPLAAVGRPSSKARRG